MARENDPLLPVAERALSNALALKVPVDSRGYCARPEENLVASVESSAWRQAKDDLGAGQGTELASKFQAAYSSAALAVNAFAPVSGSVSLPGNDLYEGPARFEQKRSAWAGGDRPTLDVIVEEPAARKVLFVESKCLEFLRKGHADFSEAFVEHARQHLSPAAADTFAVLGEDAFAYDPLDARQLAKHFLAAKRATVDAAVPCRVTLLAVAWEPANAGEYPIFARHKQAMKEFAAALPDDDVRLEALSYTELWDYWESVGSAGLRRHVSLLRERYDVKLE